MDGLCYFLVFLSLHNLSIEKRSKPLSWTKGEPMSGTQLGQHFEQCYDALIGKLVSNGKLNAPLRLTNPLSSFSMALGNQRSN